jgi:copper resistance protein D
VTVLFAVTRALHFASLMAVFGAAAFSVLAQMRRGDPMLHRPLAWASVVALVTAVLCLCFVSGEMTGDSAATVDPAAIVTVAAHTMYGHVFLARFVLLAITCVLCFIDTAPGFKALTSGLALALLGLTSHAAAAGDPHLTYARAAIDAAHLLAAGFWLGGLIALLPTTFGKPRDVPLLVARLRLFSAWGMVAVAILALAGTFNAVAILGVAGMRWSPSYLTWLAVKLVLAGLMIALALTNRFGIVPGLARGEQEAQDTVPITLVAELSCAALILLAVGFLGLTAPMAM